MLGALRRLETDGRMNQSLSSRNQQGDLNWVLESWDRSSGAVGGGGGGGILTRIHQGGELDSSMLAAAALPHNTASWSAASGAADGHGGGEPKAYISPMVGVGGPRQPYYNSLAMPSSPHHLPHNHMMMGGSCSVPLTLTALDSHRHHQQQHYHQNSSLQPSLGFTNIPGLVPSSSSSHVDFIRSGFEQQQQQQQQRIGMYSGLMDMGQNQLSLNSSIKREDVYGDGYGRIGLNLGVRTYFSTEDMLAARLLGKRPRAGSPVPMCQAQGCKADLSMAKHYHRRHKVCEMHSKASTVTANGQTQRFCQQCSRFHALSEFDEGKRSCRKRLADHNRRRRKPQINAVAAGAGASTTDEDHQSETSTKVDNDMADTKLDLKKKNSSTSASDNSDGSVKLQSSSSAPATSSEEKPVEPHPPSESELGTGTTLLSSSQQPEARSQAIEEQHPQAVGSNLSLGGSAEQPHSNNADDTWLRKRDLASIANSPVDFSRLEPGQSSDQQQVHSNWSVGDTGPRFHWYS